ncbi:MAG: hypothetical protein AB7P12_18930 [Alphaproteobacteria bacterium]
MLLAACTVAWPAAASTVGDRSLAKVLEGMGGAATIDRIKTLVVTASGKRTTPAGVVELRTRSYYRYPIQFRQEVEAGGTRIAMVSTPHGAYLLGQDNVVELPPADRHNIEVTALRNLVTLMKARHNRFFVADRGDPVTIDGRSAEVVEITVREERATIAFDAASGRVLRQTYEVPDAPGGKPGTMVVVYSDFGEVAPGLVLPKRAVGRLNGDFAFDSAVEAVEVDVDIAPELFGPVPIGASRARVPAPPR